MSATVARGTLLALALALTSLAQAQGCRNRFVLFGDSLSDSGNLYAVSGQTVKAPFTPIPDWPYSIGGHHLSNGSTWAEQLAAAIGSPASGAPAELNPLFTNYAFAGARARPDGPFPELDLTTQVNLFVANFGACRDPLYFLWIGGDDLRDALSALQSDPSGATSIAIVTAAVQSIAANVVALANAGAQKFVIFDVPDISRAPYVMALPQPVIEAATLLSAQFNAGLGLAIHGLQQQGIQITRFDPNPLIVDVEADPGAYGLTDSIHPCLTFGVIAHAICRSPPKYFFWDGIHPTTVGHGILANEVRAKVLP